MNKVKVLIVDDSAVVRKVLSEVFEAAPGIDLIAVAADPIFAMQKMEKEWPDVIVLDIEMPRMDGITFLKKIMKERPTPVVICSTLTEKGAETTMSAMSAGAIDIVMKPKIGLKAYLQEQRNVLVDTIKSAAGANVGKLKRVSVNDNVTLIPPSGAPKLSADAVLSPPSAASLVKTTEAVVAIGTSTGGTQALEQILTKLPRVSPGIVIVQHMPEKFTTAFANRLNSLCEIQVSEAKDNERVTTGKALIAPGGKHMMLKRSGAQYYVEVADGPLVSRHRPSVDVLFRSVTKIAGKNALGIIMTGMGDDGANGMAEMHAAGAETIAQDEATCVVFGMPKEAIARGGVDKVIPLDDIPMHIMRYLPR